MIESETTGRTILAGIDGTDAGQDALALARELAGLRGAQLVAGAVYRREYPVFPGSDALEGDLRRIAEGWLEAAKGLANVPVQMRTVRATSPAKGLHELAEQIDAELIVVGSSHRGSVGRVLPGGVGERLLQELPCAVSVAPRGYATQVREPVRVVAVGYDLSDESEVALGLAADLAGAAGGTLRILTADDSGAAVLEDAREHLRRTVMERRDSLPSELRADGQVVLRGEPTRVLLDELDKGVDLMVMGSRGYGPLGRALLGSVAAHVVRRAPCPVVIVPRAAARDDNGRALAGPQTSAAA